MKLDFIEEPELEFGGLRRHVDIREGLKQFGPLDIGENGARRIRAGIVGTKQTMDGLQQWFERCRNGVAAKASKQPNLFAAFPGFGDESPFRTDFDFDASLCRVLPARELRALAQQSHYKALFDGVEMVASEVRAITEHGRPDVVLIALPPELVGLDDEEEEDPDGKAPLDMQLSFFRSYQALRRAVRQMIIWAPERIIIAHGRWYRQNAVKELRRSFRWVL